ncbi:MAG TPA: type IV pilus secretin PilQ [Candidatus Angelobacter sp.]|nr:type IV pilus secretin PilQ [Candidatus Angelobacter sp.]
MRLKQLLGTILLATAVTAAATASASQLSGVLVKNQDSAGVVTIVASGAFTHTEYRPSDNLMLVDLAGVSIAHPDSAAHAVFAPGVRSYRVVGYRSASGAETTRVELSLLPGAKVNVSDVPGGVELRVTGAAAAVPSKEMITKAADALSKSTPHNQIRDISVSHNPQGLDVEIMGNGPLTAKTMKLTGPDRLVLDIPDAVWQGRPREITVNSNGVKAIRAARYQDDPPVTRIVVDLASARPFDLVPSGNKLVVKLNDASHAAPAAVPAPAPVAASLKEAETAHAPAPVVAAAVPAPAVKKEEKVVEAETSRADKAASHFARETAIIPSTNQPPYASSASLASQPAAAVNAALQQQSQTPAPITAPTSSCTSGRYTGEPIGLNFKDLDLKDFFKVIQEISGLNVVLDPAVHGTVSIYLNDVPWDQALAIVLNNNGLECQLQGNVLRIATLETLKTEAEARRAQQEAQALAVPKVTITRYLSYGQSKDAVPIIKKFLSARGDVVADPRSNAVIIEDIPATLPKVEELIRTLDKKTPEVEVEARVVASTRTFARDIGTQLAVGFASGHSSLFGAPALGNSPIITNQVIPSTTINPVTGLPNPPTTIGPSTGNLVGTGGQIPLFSNLPSLAPTSGLGISSFTANFRLDFILTAAESRGLLKILSRPHVVTQNNIPALIRQGTRVPVVTAAQLGGPPTVQYIDAFLRLTVTPQITAENTIFLNLDVENTVPDFSRVTGTQLNPSLNTQQATTSVLVSDGGTVVIGGVIQTQNSLAVNQVPLLGSIPILGHAFKHTLVNTSTQELIFFITPKIIQT